MATRRPFTAAPLPVLAFALLLISACAQGTNNSNNPDAGGQAADADTNAPDADLLLSACDADPCFAGVECTDTEEGFSCGHCPSGLEGDGQSCTDIDSCAAGPCFLGVECTDLPAPEDGFSCGACPDGFFGNGVVCTDVDGCDGNPCFPGAQCVDNPPPATGFTCGTCPTGYEGDGFTCTDIDGCAGDPCFEGLSCSDNPAPQVGFQCQDCPPGHIGDGVSCTLLCDAAATISCGGLISASNSASGSADLVDNWQCSSFALTGPEIVYTFVAPTTGMATAELTGLSADLDLLVIKASTTVPGLCDPLSSMACVPGGSSSRAGTTSERSRWSAVAGTTYFIVVDGFAGAVSNFNLRVKTGSEDIVLNEIGFGIDDFVEVGNRGACSADLGGLGLSHKPSLDSAAASFLFANGTNLPSGGVLRWVEVNSGPYAANEIDAGVSFLDLPNERGFTALCTGACNMSTCANFLDYVERDDNLNDAKPTGGPACASFAPAPVNSLGQSGEVSLHRVGFSGTSSAHVASDWAFGPSSRD